MTVERPGRVPRRHETIPHTADVGVRATGPDLPALFEEAAAAVADIAADAASSSARQAGSLRETIALDAVDLPGLAFAWLNELIGLADIHGPLIRSEIATIDAVPGDGWRLSGRATFGGSAVPRLDIKSATYHGLTVERIAGGWRLTAYLDV